MDGAHKSSAQEETYRALRTAQVDGNCADPAHLLATQLGTGPFSMVCLFVTPEADFDALTRATRDAFGDCDVLCCTTAGELGAAGYEDGQIVAVAFPQALFSVSTYVISELDRIDDQEVIDTLIQRRIALAQRAPRMPSEFAFLMVDGLSLREEHLTGVLASGLGPTPLFGGSAGDGTRFGSTRLALNGDVQSNAAILALVRSHCPVRVFSLDHLIPTDTRMVVTLADPEARVVYEINAEPAAQEYARLLRLDPMQLDPFTFAAHPVTVRVGDTHHVRAIQRVSDEGHLVFFSAINEGMVLTVAQHNDMAAHLREGLSALGQGAQAPDQILGCDCLLRRIEAGQVQKTREISTILREFNVVGFSTYGEQIGGLHVNQTLTGVAIYPPVFDEDGT